MLRTDGVASLGWKRPSNSPRCSGKEVRKRSASCAPTTFIRLLGLAVEVAPAGAPGAAEARATLPPPAVPAPPAPPAAGRR
eukprot:1058366-Alexandrium_andersonii.AAC.1